MTDHPLDGVFLATLRALGDRGSETEASRLHLVGYSDEQVSAAVHELVRGGYVVAKEMQEIGTSQSYWEPSTLTKEGRELLERVTKLL